MSLEFTMTKKDERILMKLYSMYEVCLCKSLVLYYNITVIYYNILYIQYVLMIISSLLLSESMDGNCTVMFWWMSECMYTK